MIIILACVMWYCLIDGIKGFINPLFSAGMSIITIIVTILALLQETGVI